MLQNPCKTLGFKKNMVYKIPPGGGGGKPYPASGLHLLEHINQDITRRKGKDKDSTVNKTEYRSKRNPKGKPLWAYYFSIPAYTTIIACTVMLHRIILISRTLCLYRKSLLIYMVHNMDQYVCLFCSLQTSI